MEEEDVRGDRGLSVFRLRAVSRLTLVVRCTEIGYSVSTQVLGFRFGCGWCCVVGFLFGCCWFCVLLLCVSAWWNRGILDEVTKASFGRAVTGTAVMARSANEEKKTKTSTTPISHIVTTTFPSFPHIEVLVPDPTPRSRTPRRDTDPLFPELIPDSHPPWVQPGVTPVGAPGTTPLRPPWDRC